MFGKQEEKRFIRIYEEGSLNQGVFTAILKDRETGVHYLERLTRNWQSLIPLLGSNGKPIIEPVESE